MTWLKEHIAAAGLTLGNPATPSKMIRIRDSTHRRDQPNGRMSLRFRGPDAHRGGVTPRCYARIGTDKVAGNQITCAMIARGSKTFQQAQVSIELYSDGRGSYTAGTDECEFFSGIFSSVKRKTKTIQLGTLRLIFDDTAAQRKAWKALQRKIQKWKRCC